MSLSQPAANAAVRLVAGFTWAARGQGPSDFVEAWNRFLETQEGVATYEDLVETFAASPAYLALEQELQKTLQGVRR